ncbi:hypothetical protein EZJ19_08810 [Parasulfuritortus cantonensis]|uniref:Peptidase M48 domain-containing protein n=1 Tax=Parasulfuritortus cantonensis TaxID=2528202 RepID=A0A4R1BD27_9PROT|nr:M48 family metallopeptidase [Parasulfuritortus cantonensis]TCJ14970.1 hypothetical protein EZJ19_08810 [Parasulfuritortus cantonensis]
MASTTEQREHFQDLIRRAEALGAADPAAYRRRLALLAVLGYAVLFGVLFLLLALLVGSVWGALASTALLILLIKKKLIILLGYLVYAIGRALWVRFDPPEGRELDLRQYPALAAVLADLSRQLATPTLHSVMLTDEFNASVVQTPRLGVFGWPRNTLMLGLPLLLAMSPDQARALLGHELGHLSGNHGRFGAWIYRVRQTWDRVMQAFDRSGDWGSRLMARFFDWYAPHFGAYSFALARAEEYQADALSARVTSAADAAACLVASHVGAGHLAEAYWRPFLARADLVERPEAGPYGGMARFLADSAGERFAGLQPALAVETGYTDTHPSLADRLRALGVPAPEAGPARPSAAEVWFGDRCDALLAEFDRTWLERNAGPWEARYRETAEMRARLAELEARPEETLSADEAWQRAAWSERLGLDALAHYQAYAGRYPDDLDAEFSVGRLLLARDDAAGLAHLERAAARFDLALPVCEVAYDYCRRVGDRDGADAWLRRGEAQFDREARGRAERAGVMAKDTFAGAVLAEAELAALARELAAVDGVKQAWICRKVVEVDPDSPVHVIVVQRRGWFTREAKLLARLGERVSCPGLAFFMIKGGSAGRVAKRAIGAGRPLL